MDRVVGTVQKHTETGVTTSDDVVRKLNEVVTRLVAITGQRD